MFLINRWIRICISRAKASICLSYIDVYLFWVCVCVPVLMCTSERQQRHPKINAVQIRGTFMARNTAFWLPATCRSSFYALQNFLDSNSCIQIHKIHKTYIRYIFEKYSICDKYYSARNGVELEVREGAARCLHARAPQCVCCFCDVPISLYELSDCFILILNVRQFHRREHWCCVHRGEFLARRSTVLMIIIYIGAHIRMMYYVDVGWLREYLRTIRLCEIHR